MDLDCFWISGIGFGFLLDWIGSAIQRSSLVALSFNVEPEGSIKLKYLNLGRCNSKNKLALMNGSLTKIAKV